MGARVLHPHAPFTVTRAAIEAGAIVGWLLGPRSRSDRVVRRCRQALQDAADGDAAAAEIGEFAGPSGGNP